MDEKQTKILSGKDPVIDREGIEEAGRILRDGGLVAIPTETVYGLAGNALQGDVAERIFAAKGRPSDNPLIVHISAWEQLLPLVSRIPEHAKELADAFWPGPLTMIFPKSGIVPTQTTGGLATVAIRMPSHPVARAIIDAAGVPLAAPSANRSGRPSTTTAEHCVEDLSGRIDAIVDGGPCEFGVESTVLSLVSVPPKILRPGAVTKEQLETILPAVEVDPAVVHPLAEGAVAASPGMKYKHYSPKAEVILVEGSAERFRSFFREHLSPGTYALVFTGEGKDLGGPYLEYGRKEDPLDQAEHLFAALREMDELGAKTVYVRCPSQDGVGLAVYNRLLRAAAFEVIDV